jgi:hypothetical protein
VLEQMLSPLTKLYVLSKTGVGNNEEDNECQGRFHASYLPVTCPHHRQACGEREHYTRKSEKRSSDEKCHGPAPDCE